MNHRATLLLCLAVPAAATAQVSLSEQIAAAVPGEDWSEQLARLELRKQPYGDIVDALVPLRDKLRRHLWSRALSLATQRQQELEALWNAEPSKRRSRAPIFADVLGLWIWAGHYQQATTAEERADIEEVARFLAPFRQHEEQPFVLEAQETRLAAATKLQRIAVAAIKAGPNPYPEQLRRTENEGYEQLPLLAGEDAACSPFHLTSVLVDPDLQLRARAAAALRRTLRLEPTPWLAHALARDPAPAIRQFASSRSTKRGALTDAEATELIALLAEDDVARPMRQLENRKIDALGADARAQLAQALIDAGLRAPADPPPVPQPNAPGRQPVLVAPNLPPSLRASWCFALAAQLGATQFQLVLALAESAKEERVVERVVTALAGLHELPEGDLPGAAGPLIALLEHRTDAIARGASTLTGRLLAQRDEPALRAKLGDLAIAALAEDATALTFGHGLSGFCGTGPAPLGPPTTKEAAWVKAAAASGEVRLLDPLIAELERIRALAPAAGLAATSNPYHEWFVLACLDDLAHLTDRKQARQLHELLGAAAQVPNSWARARAARSAWEDRTELLVRDVVFGIYPTVPDDLLPWYIAALADSSTAIAFAHRIDRVSDLVPEDRAKQALETADARYLESCTLWLRVPELLVARWNAGDEKRIQAQRILDNAWPKKVDRIMKLVAAGRLPRELAAASVPYGSPPLSVLAELLTRSDAEAVARLPGLADAIRRTPAVAPDDDLRALRELAASPMTEFARAAACRAAALGAEGQELARATFARLVAVPDLRAASEALGLAVDAGIEVPGLAELVARLQKSPYASPRMIADAAALRFLGAEVSACTSGFPAHVILRAKIDVDVATLRKALGKDATMQLPLLLLDGSIGTRVSSLRLAMDLPSWTLAIERGVTAHTSHADARVRLAAYEALRSRDADVWACALLVHEAVFDPDTAVQQFGRNLQR